MHQIFIISDGSGGTADRALRAALTQFPDIQSNIQIWPEVREEKQVKNAILEAKAAKGFVVHTVVAKELRDFIGKQGRLHNVKTIDIMGPLLAQLAHQFSDSPAEKPGLFHELNKEYFRRIEAMEFAFRHDDGLRTHELEKAEIVMIGVSRTFKTPLSIYLAFKGWSVANIPIILDFPTPKELDLLDPKKVFCLTTDTFSLVNLRKVRHEHLGGSTGKYASVDYVRQELLYANRFFNRHKAWSIIDVTNKPIEEIASEILQYIRESQ